MASSSASASAGASVRVSFAVTPDEPRLAALRSAVLGVRVALVQFQSARDVEELVDVLRSVAQCLVAADVALVATASSPSSSLAVAPASRAALDAAHAAVLTALGAEAATSPATLPASTASLVLADPSAALPSLASLTSLRFSALELSYDSVSIGVFPLGTDRVLRSSLFVRARWVAAVRGTLLPVVNPATKALFHAVAAATADDVAPAVAAAHAAFPVWRDTPAAERARLLTALADAILSHKQRFIELEILDTGKPWKEADMDMSDAADCFKYYARMIVERDAELRGTPLDVGNAAFTCEVVQEPIGVCALIVPWNYPLLMATWKLAPCLASGCSCVIKPSELTPLTLLELAALTTRLGFPPGVLNVLTGYGPDAGAPLVAHPLVRKVAFTGSVATGARVAQTAAQGIKKFTLELGGKSALIAHKDADVDAVVDWASFGIFWNAGQNCTATSRLLLHDDIYEPVLQKLSALAQRIKLGSGFDRSATLGPLINETQYRKVVGYIQSALDEGALARIGGVPADAEGYYVAPTVLVNVTPTMRVWREEIFGPVLAVLRYADVDEALRLANDTQYGLGAAVMTRDAALGKRVARALEAGVVWVNCSQPTFCTVPFGGYKQSGIGRELGTAGLDAYLETKQISTWVDPKATGWGWFL